MSNNQHSPVGDGYNKWFEDLIAEVHPIEPGILNIGLLNKRIYEHITQHYVPKPEVAEREREAHQTANNWCCACEADIALFSKREREARIDELKGIDTYLWGKTLHASITKYIHGRIAELKRGEG